MSMKSLKKQQTFVDRGQISGMPGSFLTDIRPASCAVSGDLVAGGNMRCAPARGDRDKTFSFLAGTRGAARHSASQATAILEVRTPRWP